jgi:hypothetical protein
LQDKTAISQRTTVSNGKTTFTVQVGVVGSDLKYDFRSPYTSSVFYRNYGSYTISNGGTSGNWSTSEGSDFGIFEIISSDPSGVIYTSMNRSNSANDSKIIAKFVLPITGNDIKSKSLTVANACNNGSDAVITFDSNAKASENCGLGVNGTIWTAGPFPNTLQYADSAGKISYIVLTFIDKKGGSGNLPSGASASMARVYSSGDTPEDYKVLLQTAQFKVN